MIKTALITGATSGIGKAAARGFAAAGWRVIATGRRSERLEALVDAIGADKVHPAAFDVADEAARDAALARLPEGFRDGRAFRTGRDLSSAFASAGPR